MMVRLERDGENAYWIMMVLTMDHDGEDETNHCDKVTDDADWIMVVLIIDYNS